MNSIATAGNSPIATLFARSVEKTRIPSKRHSDCTAVFQADAQRVLIDRYVGYTFIRGCCRKTHTKLQRVLLVGLR